ncbi:DotA/TraY family protein [Marinobacter salsuginis]|jgi:conjugal transfer/type IV secretion protein DotA/TraY|nr:DotA/TraY family protein [Marinobacter salsuginis]
MEDESWIDTARTLFEPAPQSVAETLLAKVFGNWVFSENAGRGLDQGPLIYGNFMGVDEVALLTTLLGYSGILAAAFGLIISSYTFIMQMVKNAWSGSFAADGINSVFWPARTVAALALIIPIVTVGTGDRQTQIATSQLMMMEVAKAGSGFADNVTAAYVTNAFAYPLNNTRPPDTPDAVIAMFENASCAVILAAKEGQNEPKFATIATAHRNDGTAVSFVPSNYVNNADVTAWRQSLSNTPGSGTRRRIQTVGSIQQAVESAFNEAETSRISFGSDGKCGQITFSSERDSRSNAGGSSSTVASYLQAAQDAVVATYKPSYRSLTTNMFQFVESRVVNGSYEELIATSSRIDPAQSQEAAVLYQTIIEFNTLVFTNVSNSLANLSNQLSGNLFQPIISGGWAALGAIYNVIPRISSLAISNTTDAHSLVSSSIADIPCAEEASFFGWNDDEDCEAKDDILSYSSLVVDLTRQYRASFNDSQRPDIGVLDYCTISQCNLRAAQASTATTISQALLGTMAGAGNWLNRADWDNENASENVGVNGNGDPGRLGERDWRATRDPHPLNTLAGLGTSMQALGWGYQAAKTKVVVLEKTIDKASTSAIPLIGGLGGAATALLGLLAGFLETLSLAMITTGFYLTFVLPMIPFLIFAMQVVGWLATTIEGMFAVTFAVSLLTNSDGDGAINTGFLKALSLTAAIFLKPFFIVIGVAVANAVAGPVFAFFNTQFWRAWDVDNALSGSGSSIIFEISAQLLVYVIAVTILVRFIYSIQYIIPDSMNNWISGGIVNPFGVPDAANEVQGSVKGQVSAVTGAAIPAAAKASQAASERKGARS